MAKLIKTLTLTLDTKTVECQLDSAQLIDSPESEEVTTFCGTDTSTTPNYELALGGFQDWGDVAGVCEVLHASYVDAKTNSDGLPSPVAFVLTVGTATRTGTCRPTADVPFGGDAGSALKFTVTLDVVGEPVDGTAVVAAAAPVKVSAASS